ncbi:MAG: hypothetical protein ACJASJ_001212 [Candidatus Azotimanducaceae bacterium]|jgi:hypothetical protein|tara:strand:- start:364 stop:483 length:120 start_codon:yes stop_codon:yes gene_type:complete
MGTEVCTVSCWSGAAGGGIDGVKTALAWGFFAERTVKKR